MTAWADMITALTALLVAIGTGTYRLFRDRNQAREEAMTKARDEAAAQARLEVRTEATEQAVTQLKAEIAAKDAALAECTAARTELRRLLASCRAGS